MTEYKHDLIMGLCNSKKVLHIGATDFPYHLEKANKGTLLHQNLEKMCKKIIGIDVDKKSISELKKLGINNIYFGDIVKGLINSYIKKNSWDIIVFGDIIEHLDNPGKALLELRKLCNKKTKIILTTPNVWSISYIKNVFLKKEAVHPDHTFWPSKKTMYKLIKNNGLEVISFKYCLSGLKEIKSSSLKNQLKKILFSVFKAPTLFFLLKRKENKIPADHVRKHSKKIMGVLR